MRHGSLFSGIGGFDYASQLMGWKNDFHCEWNPFCQQTLNYYWPNATSYDDITKTDFTIWRGRIDILTGGFPCQPYSTAGKRKGKDDERHLWPEMLRAIREIRPRYVVGENVSGITNWDGGLVFEEVQTDLENEGYKVRAFILPAAGVNAPHKRDRVWFVAYCADARTESVQSGRENGVHEFSTTSNTSGDRRFRNWKKIKIENRQPKSRSTRFMAGRLKGLCRKSIATNPDKLNGYLSRFRTSQVSQFKKTGVLNDNASDSNCCKRCKRRIYQEESETSIRYTCPCTAWASRGNWENFPTKSPICSGNDGISERLDFAAVFKGIKYNKRSKAYGRWRSESIKAAGNAIVPQVALQIFKAIEAYEQLEKDKQ